MLGWHFNVYPKPEVIVWVEQPYSRTIELDKTTLIATWDATLGGTRWLDDLVKEGKAVELATNGGYPLLYEFDAEDLASLIGNPPRLTGRVVRNRPLPTGRMIAEVWDQS